MDVLTEWILEVIIQKSSSFKLYSLSKERVLSIFIHNPQCTHPRVHLKVLYNEKEKAPMIVLYAAALFFYHYVLALVLLI